MFSMKKSPKCENTKIRKETGRMEGVYGDGVLFFTVYICKSVDIQSFIGARKVAQ